MSKYKNCRFMMATKATHKLGDLSRDVPDLCAIWEESGNNYIGNWVTGFCTPNKYFGFFNVKFPRSTTRPLIEKEKEKFTGMGIAINNNPIHYVFDRNDFEDNETDSEEKSKDGSNK